MPFLSELAQRKKIRYFLDPLPKNAAILEIGCGSGWVGEYLRRNGWTGYLGIDLFPPADIVGDICNYPALGLKPESFDAIVAFEVVEHVDCFRQCYELLKPGGVLLATSPIPERDWIMKLLEGLGLNQKRTSPHDHLIHFEKVPYFEERQLRRIGGLAQWGVFKKAPGAKAA